jgi:hypothetical protein
VIRTRPRLLLAAAPVAAVAAGLAGCGDGYTRDEAVTAVVEANPELTGEQAECVANGLIERYGLDEMADQLGGGASGDFTEAQFTEMFLCGDVGQVLTEQLETAGVSAEQAPCVSGEIVGSLSDDDVDALLSSEITPELSGKLTAAREACGALDS